MSIPTKSERQIISLFRHKFYITGNFQWKDKQIILKVLFCLIYGLCTRFLRGFVAISFKSDGSRQVNETFIHAGNRFEELQTSYKYIYNTNVIIIKFSGYNLPVRDQSESTLRSLSFLRRKLCNVPFKFICWRWFFILFRKSSLPPFLSFSNEPLMNKLFRCIFFVGFARSLASFLKMKISL
jgi:hypothetical protein